MACLGNIVAIIRGITFPASEKHRELSEGKIACLRTANVQDKIGWDDLLYVSSSFVKRSEQCAEIGDIVMSMANSRELVGKVAYISDIPPGNATFGGFLSVIRPYEIDAAFLMTVLRAPQTRSVLIDSSSQTTNIANISLEKLNPLIVAIPPLSEQHRIVAKVDELMALCDQLEQQSEAQLAAHQTLVETLLGALLQPSAAADGSSDSADTDELAQNWARLADHFDTLFTTEASIGTLKQTILQLAVMGKLVPQDPSDEPASSLLERIAAEKARLVKEGKIKKSKALPEISEDEKPFELPDEWKWVRLGALYSFLNGFAFKSEWFQQDGVKLLRNINIAHGETKWNEQVCISEHMATEYEKYNLSVGDIVISLDRPIINTGLKYAVIEPSDLPCLLLQRVAKFHSYSDTVEPNYLSRWLESDLFMSAVDPGRSNGVPHISTNQLEAMVFPLCSLEEQQRIVSKVDELMILCDQLKARLQTSQQTQLALAESLVEGALA